MKALSVMKRFRPPGHGGGEPEITFGFADPPLAVLFIEDFALGHDFTEERFTFGETPAQVVWSAER